jgi:hypothetical protein
MAAVAALVFVLPLPSAVAEEHAAHKPAHATYASAQLQGDERIAHVLNRFTFGPRPGDVEAVRQIGVEAWFDAQLHPALIGETELQRHNPPGHQRSPARAGQWHPALHLRKPNVSHGDA